MEHKNRTVREMEGTMLEEKHLPNKYWAKAIRMAVYLLNLCPTEALASRTLFGAWIGIKGHNNHL